MTIKLEWIPLKENLYFNMHGEIGFKTFATIGDYVDLAERFLTHFDCEQKMRLTDVIDIASFRRLGNSDFYQDNHHLYQYYAMSDGGRFSLFDNVEPEVDHNSFRVLNEFYARDKDRIYSHRNGWIRNADPSSFAVVSDTALAKDRYRNFLWGEEATPQQVSEYLSQIQ